MGKIRQFIFSLMRGSVLGSTIKLTFFVFILIQVWASLSERFILFYLSWPSRPWWITPSISASAILFFGVPIIYLAMSMRHRYEKRGTESLELRKQAEETNEQQAHFIAYISHEIRNPLNGIIGITDSIDTNKLDLENKTKVEIIRESSNELLFILNDILDLSKIEKGAASLRLVKVSLHNQLNKIHIFWKSRAEGKGLSIKLIIDKNFPDWVEVDEFRFGQIVNNLVSNAIKYTAKGSILISAKYDAEQSKSYVNITDTGQGIPENEHDRIFETYAQVHKKGSNGESRSISTGLGLPIARQLAQLMDGDIQLLSSSSAGSKFSFCFAVDAVEPPERVLSVIELGTKALVVDDSMANCIVAREYLQRIGFDVDIVRSGQECIDLILAAKQDYALMLLDENLGDMKATMVMASIKDHYQGKVIAYTGRTTDQDRNRFHEIGIHGYVAKPISYEALHNEVLKVLG